MYSFSRRSRLVYGIGLWLLTPGAHLAAQNLPALPEPGLLWYGALSPANTAGTNPPPPAAVQWSVNGNASSAVVNATVVSINGQYFYVARLPFETRQLGGMTLAPGSNTLAFSLPGALYTRAALVNGLSATIAGSTSGNLTNFGCGVTNRGAQERIDLVFGAARETFAQWAVRYFGTTNIDPNADPDGDGLTNYQEYLAGTNPLDKSSTLLINGFQADPAGGITFSWPSVPGRTYVIYRSSALTQPFTPVLTGYTAAAATSTFHDPAAASPGPWFYRLAVTGN